NRRLRCPRGRQCRATLTTIDPFPAKLGEEVAAQVRRLLGSPLNDTRYTRILQPQLKTGGSTRRKRTGTLPAGQPSQGGATSSVANSHRSTK
ncbi:MAG: hypothetical protein AAFY59_13355, partial [Pseudomonadota bacterium]